MGLQIWSSLVVGRDYLEMQQKIKCWEFFACQEPGCPVYKSKELNCWLVPGTHCRKEIQGRFLEKIEMCLGCKPLKTNMDLDSMEQTLAVVNEQFVEFRKMVEDRDRELEGISMELALGISEAFAGLRAISLGDPDVRISETSELELLTKLKHMVNVTAENLGEIVLLSHEFAIGFAEHFDVLHRVSQGDLSARVLGASKVELLEALRNVTNEMIENVSREIGHRKQVVTALKASEAQLRESEEKYRTLFDYAPNSIFVLELDTLKIVDVNARCLEVYGYGKEELIGKSFLEIGPAKYPEGVLSNRKRVWSTKHSVYPNIQHRRKDGKPFYVNVHACRRMREQKYGGIVATTIDVTESLEKETQLIQASKMSTLGEMATGVAHELNQPLSAIQIGTDFFRNMIKHGQAIPADELWLVSEQMAEQVSRAVGIINHLREFGRTGRVERQKIDINEPLKGVFTLLGQQLKARGIKFVSEFDESLPRILADSNRLEQVFIDMIVNARDAIEEKRRRALETGVESLLTVRSFRASGRVVVSISDTGIGIPEEIRDKIFDPFFTTKRPGEGTGLGLSISYGIVKEYDGVIKVESEVGKGTTFRISFPACEEP